MKATIAWWQLADSEQTIDSLRDYLRTDGTEPWNSIPGLVLKLFIADRATNRWGAIMLWESADAMKQPLPPNKATVLIGYPPNERAVFDVESTAEGIHSLTTLAGHGLALAVPA